MGYKHTFTLFFVLLLCALGSFSLIAFAQSPESIVVTTHAELTGPAEDGYINRSEILSNKILLSTPVVATNGVTVEYAVQKSPSPSTTFINCSTLTNYSASVPTTINLFRGLEGDGVYFVCVRFRKQGAETLYISRPHAIKRDILSPNLLWSDLRHSVHANASSVIPIKNAFSEGNSLKFTVSAPANPALVSASIAPRGLLLKGIKPGKTTVKVSASDKAGNSTTATFTVQILSLLPKLSITTQPTLINSAADGYINAAERLQRNSPLMRAPIASSSGAAFAYAIHYSPSEITECDEGISIYQFRVPTPHFLTPIVDEEGGTYYLCARASQKGYAPAYSQPLKIILDSVHPQSVQKLLSRYSVEKGDTISFDISGEFNEPSTFKVVQLSGSARVTISLVGSQLTLTALPSSQLGTAVLEIAATDIAGNPGKSKRRISIFVTAPRIVIAEHPVLTPVVADGYISTADVAADLPLLTSGKADTEGVTVRFRASSVNSRTDRNASCSFVRSSNHQYSTDIPTTTSITKNGLVALCIEFSKPGFVTWYAPRFFIMRDTTAPKKTARSSQVAMAKGGSFTLSPHKFFVKESTPSRFTLSSVEDSEIATVSLSDDGTTLSFAALKEGKTSVSIQAADVAGNTTTRQLSLVVSSEIVITKEPRLSGVASDGKITLAERLSEDPVINGIVVSLESTTFSYAMVLSTTPVTTCTASTGTYKETVPNAVSFVSDGIYYLCVKAANAPLSPVYSAPLRIAVSSDVLFKMPPRLLDVASDGFIKNSESDSGQAIIGGITTHVASPTIMYAVIPSSTPLEECTLSSGTYQRTPPSALSFSTDGTYSLCVQVFKDNFPPSFFGPLVMLRDTKAPTISDVSAPSATALSHDITAVFEDTTSGLSYYRVALIDASDRCDSTTERFDDKQDISSDTRTQFTTPAYTVYARNNKRVCYEVADNAGNISYTQSRIIPIRSSTLTAEVTLPDGEVFVNEEWTTAEHLTVLITDPVSPHALTIDLSRCDECRVVPSSREALGNGGFQFVLETGKSSSQHKEVLILTGNDIGNQPHFIFRFGADKSAPSNPAFPSIVGLNSGVSGTTLPATDAGEVMDVGSGVWSHNVYGFVADPGDCIATIDTASFLPLHSSIEGEGAWLTGSVTTEIPQVPDESQNGKYLCRVLQDRVGNIAVRVSDIPVAIDLSAPRLVVDPIPEHSKLLSSAQVDTGYAQLANFFEDTSPITYAVTLRSSDSSVRLDSAVQIHTITENSLLAIRFLSPISVIVDVRATDAFGRSTTSSFIFKATDMFSAASAEIPPSGDRIVLTFEEDIAPESAVSALLSSAFSLSVTAIDGEGESVSHIDPDGTITVDGSIISLPLRTYWTFGDTVTLTYTAPSSGTTLQNTSGARVGSFTILIEDGATPSSDTIAPEVRIYAESARRAGLQKEGVSTDHLFYSSVAGEIVKKIPVRAEQTFYVVVRDRVSGEVLVSGVDQVIAALIPEDDTCPSVTALKDGTLTTGEIVLSSKYASLPTEAVVEITTDLSRHTFCVFVEDGNDNTLTPPVLESAPIPFGTIDTTIPTLERATLAEDSSAITLTFSEPLTTTSPPVSAFSLNHTARALDGSAVSYLTSVTISGNTVTLPLSVHWGTRGALRLSYTPPSIAPLRDIAENEVIAFETAVTFPESFLDDEDTSAPSIIIYQENGKAEGLQTSGLKSDTFTAAYRAPANGSRTSGLYNNVFSDTIYVTSTDTFDGGTTIGTGVDRLLIDVVPTYTTCPATVSEFSDTTTSFEGIASVSRALTLSATPEHAVSLIGRTLCFFFADREGNTGIVEVHGRSSSLPLSSEASDRYISLEESRSSNTLLATVKPFSPNTTVAYALKHSADPITSCETGFSTLFKAALPRITDLKQDGDYYLCVRGTRRLSGDVDAVEYLPPRRIRRDTVIPTIVPDATLSYAITTGTPVTLPLTDVFNDAVRYTVGTPSDERVISASISSLDMLHISGIDEGSATVEITGHDVAGNSVSEVVSVVVFASRIKFITKSVLTNDATDGYISAPESTKKSALITAPIVSPFFAKVQYALKTSTTAITTCDAGFGTYTSTRPTVASLTGDGTYYICVMAATAGLTTQYSEPVTLVRDTTVPELLTSAKTSYTLTVTTPATISVDTLFAGATEYAVADPTDTNVITASFASPTLTITPIDSGTSSIVVTGRDSAGNSHDVTLTIEVSSLALTAKTAPTLLNDAADGFITLKESTETTALVSAPVTTPAAIAKYAVKHSSTAITTCDATFGTYSTTVPTAVDLSKDGDHYLCALSEKKGYITIYTTPLKVVRDTVAPSIVADTPLTYAHTIEDERTIDLSDIFTGAVTYSVGAPSDSSVISASFSTPELTFNAVGKGESTIVISATDTAGNSTEATITVTVSLFTLTFTSQPTLANDAVDGYVNAQESSATTSLVATSANADVAFTYALKQSSSAIATCDAGFGTYTSTRPTVASLTSDGTYYICVRAIKTKYAPLYSTPLKVTHDSIAPQSAIGAKTSYTLTVTTPATISVDTLFAGATEYAVADPTDTNVITASFASPTLTITPIDSGTSSIVVTGRDSAGNSHDVTLTIEVSSLALTAKTAPTLLNDAADGFITLKESTETTALVSAPVTTPAAIAKYAVKHSSTAITTCDATFGTYSTTVPTAVDLSKDGDHYLCALSEKKGYITIYTTPLKVVRDTVAPSIVADTPLTYAHTIEDERTIDLSDIFTGAVTYSVGAPSDSSVISASFSTPELTFNAVGKGESTIVISATDTAGNSTEATITVTVSLFTLTFTSQPTLANDAVDGYVNASELRKVAFALVTAAETTQDTTITYALHYHATDALSICDASSGTYASALPTTTALTKDGMYSLCARAEKERYDAHYSSPLVIVRDTVAPTIAQGAKLVHAVNTITPVTIDLSTIFSNDAVTYAAGTPSDTAILTTAFESPNLTLTGIGNTSGTSTITVTGFDQAGNSIRGIFTINVTASTITITTPAALINDAEDGYINEDESTNTTALVSAAVTTPTTTTEYAVKHSTNTISACDASFATYSATAPTATSLTKDGDHYICVRSKKGTNLISYHTPLKVVRDTSDPSVAADAPSTLFVIADRSETIATTSLFTDEAVHFSAGSPAETEVATASLSLTTLIITGVAKGNTKIVVTGFDAAGNSAEITIALTVTDAVITVITPSKLINDAEDGWINTEEVKNSVAFVSAPVTFPATTATYAMKHSAGAISSCDASFATYSATAPTAASLTKDGDHYICVQIQTGGLPTVFSAPIKLTQDTIVPVVSDVPGDDGRNGVGLIRRRDIAKHFTGATRYVAEFSWEGEHQLGEVIRTDDEERLGPGWWSARFFRPGTITVTYTAFDDAGNSVVAEYDIIIPIFQLDTHFPLISEEVINDGYLNKAEYEARKDDPDNQQNRIFFPYLRSNKGAVGGGLPRATVELLIKKTETAIVCEDETDGYVQVTEDNVQERMPTVAYFATHGEGSYYFCTKVSRPDAPELFLTGYLETPFKLIFDSTPPAKKLDIPALSLYKGEDSSLDLTEYFVSEEGITYSAVSDDEDVVTVSVTGATLTVNSESIGTATVTVSGTDIAGNPLTLPLSISIVAGFDS